METPLLKDNGDGTQAGHSAAENSYRSRWADADYKQISTEVKKLKDISMAEKTKKLRKLKLFPIFSDPELARCSPSFFLYLEFFYGIIRMLFWILVILGLPTAAYVYFVDHANPFFKSNIKADARFSFVYLGIMGSFLVSLLRKREENAIWKNEGLYDKVWTEDMFTLLVKKLPLDTTALEIKQHFETHFPRHKDMVEDVILLQDYYRYNKIELAIKTAMRTIMAQEKILTTAPAGSPQATKAQATIDKCNATKDALMKDLLVQRKEIFAFNNFQGKALVIFKTPAIQNEVYQAYHYTLKEKIMKLSFIKNDPKFFIKGKKIEVHSFGPPDDIMFEYLHYPMPKRILRNLASFSIMFVLFWGSLYFFLGYLGGLNFVEPIKKIFSNEIANSGAHEIEEDYTTKGFWLDLKHYTQPIYMTFYVLCISWVIGTTLTLVEQFKITSNNKKLGLALFRYGYFQAAVNFVFIEALIQNQNGTHNWIRQIRLLILSLWVRKLIFKGLDMITVRCKPSWYVTFVHNLIGVAKEFDAYGGVSNLIPLTFLAFTFYSLNPFLILGLIIATLYTIAAIDKYRMLRLCDFPQGDTRNLLIRVFDSYKLFPYLFFFGSLNALRVLHREYIDHDLEVNNNYFYYCIAIGIVGRIAAYIFCPQTIVEDIQQNFIDKHGSTTYEEARREFTNCYRLQYRWSNIQDKNSVDTGMEKLGAIQTADIAVTDIFIAPGDSHHDSGAAVHM